MFLAREVYRPQSGVRLDVSELLLPKTHRLEVQASKLTELSVFAALRVCSRQVSSDYVSKTQD